MQIKDKSLLYHAIMSELDDRDIYFFETGHWSFTMYEYPAVKDRIFNIIKPGSLDPGAEFNAAIADIERQLP